MECIHFILTQIALFLSYTSLRDLVNCFEDAYKFTIFLKQINLHYCALLVLKCEYGMVDKCCYSFLLFLCLIIIKIMHL